jgi:transposase
MPLGYEVFAGNRTDVTTVQEIVEKIESLYGQADRVWVMDRGMVSQANVAFLSENGRRYILGTSRSQLKKYERELVDQDWTTVHEGLQVKQVASPAGGDETFILCRSTERREKEKAMHAKFMNRIEEGLTAIGKSCEQRKQDPIRVAGRVGRLLGKNTRAEPAFAVDVQRRADGGATLQWTRNARWLHWAALSEGCYLLRSNIPPGQWTPAELWHAYMQLTQAEAAFGIHKSDLQLRPVWHQKEHRVGAHILVCFLAYVLWKTLALRCQRAGLGDEPRKVLDELSRIKIVDVALPTRGGPILHQQLISRPTDHQAILLHRLGLTLPSRLKTLACSEDF